MSLMEKGKIQMEATFDFVKGDPCYGCAFASPKTEDEINEDGMFARRFICANGERIEGKEGKAILAIKSHQYDEAVSVLSELGHMTRRGISRMECEACFVRPMCYIKKEEKK